MKNALDICERIRALIEAIHVDMEELSIPLEDASMHGEPLPRHHFDAGMRALDEARSAFYLADFFNHYRES